MPHNMYFSSVYIYLYRKAFNGTYYLLLIYINNMCCCFLSVFQSFNANNYHSSSFEVRAALHTNGVCLYRVR